jgi:hypothetical protein
MKNLSSLPIWYSENETPKASLHKVKAHFSCDLFCYGGFVYGGKDGTGSLFRWSLESCGWHLRGPKVQGMGLADILSTSEGEIVNLQD